MNWLTANRRRVAPKTTGRRLTSLRAFAKWAGWGDLLAEYSAPTPARGVPHPLPEGIDGVRRLIVCTHNEKQKALIALCGLCGLRVSEALAAKPSDFDLSDMMLTVRGKGDKTRKVPVSDEAWEVLCTPVTRAFACGDDREVVGLKDRFARRVVTQLGSRAHLKRHVASHDLRATFATAALDNCGNIRTVQELLGHGNVTTTQLYTLVSVNSMKAAVRF